MDLDKLKSEHPATYKAAVQVGVNAERERVESFLIAGEQSGDMKLAVTSIQDGAEMNGKLLTQFTMAAANRRDLGDRADDDTEAAGADGAARETGEGDTAASELNAVAGRLAELMGYEGDV